MLVMCLIYFFLFTKNINGQILPTKFMNNNKTNCVQKILTNYYEYASTITIVDLNTDNIELVRDVHLMGHISILSKKIARKRVTMIHRGYLIIGESSRHIIKEIEKLTMDREWNPYVKFLILIDNKIQDIKELYNVFETLMMYHISNVVVICGANNFLYTYNPYENYGCGKKFQRVIELGNCLNPDLPELYPGLMQLGTGFTNCTFSVLSAHNLPYTNDYSRSLIKQPGAEECTLNLISKLEKFNLNYTYKDMSEEYSFITDRNKATGPLSLIQNNEYDILIGGIFFTAARARAFGYIYSHMAYDDDIRIFVRKAKEIPKWKKVFLEFQPLVWVLLLLSFVTYSAVAIFLFKKIHYNDKTSIVLTLWDNVFLHARNCTKARISLKYYLIIWLWFTFLVNSYYTTSLMSLTSTQVQEFQVKSRYDLLRFNYKPCVSPSLNAYTSINKASDILKERDYENFDYLQSFANNTECESLLTSLEVTGKSTNLFTVATSAVYETSEHLFLDEDGRTALYMFDKPLNKIITAMYFYKGFPNLPQLHNYILRMRQGGHIKRCLNAYFGASMKKNSLKSKHITYILKLMDLLIPYCILFVGFFLCIVVFILEILVGIKMSSSLCFMRTSI